MNKIKQLLTILAFAPALCQAQTSTENYVMTETRLDANGTNAVKSVQYYNGLGYPTVSVGVVGGKGETAYSLTTYDALGREECKYVPVFTDYSILYKDPNTIISNVKNKYNDNQAYSKTQYDALDRPISVTTAGSAFSGKPTKIEYSSNTASEVIRYGVSNDNLTQNSYYPANTLTKEINTDPDGKKVETFKDLFGNLIMQRVNGNLCTYYVYDNLGRLRFVLPPKYQSEKDLAKTCYKYKYDAKGRLVTKTLPGCDSIKYWYDNADRMISMRDPRLRSAGKYRFFIYDKFDRMVVQGVCTSCSWAGTVRNATFNKSAAGVLGTSYVMPTEYANALKNAELEIANYYDMNQDSISGNKKAYFSRIKRTATISQTEGLTGTLVATSNGDFLAQIMVYDLKGNVIGSNSSEIDGSTVSHTNKYTFTNKLLTSDTYVNVKYGSGLTIGEAYGYSDKIDKKWAYTISVNHGTQEKATFSYNYDELGRSSRISRNNLPSDKDRYVYYNYDMRGWLKEIKTDRFTEELFYADGPGTKYYNGNISSIRWKDNTSSVKRGYMFVYDGANRMRAAAYGEGENLTSNPNRYNEEIKYDENGNIIRVIRNGKTSSGYGVMDNLTISYSGNQPSSVSEAAADYDNTGSFEYKKAKGTGYKFNNSGSLIADKSRGIAYITYDLNNNPQQIYFTNGNVTKYIYSASGQKLRAIHYTAKPNVTRTWGKKPTELTLAQILLVDSTDYLLGGRLVMKNGKIDKVLFDGGYAQASVASATTDKFAFYYYNQDHLGNNREVVDASGTVTQATNYYPFGAPYADASASKGADVQPYKYNGKELDLMHGLNTYDYGARQYDPILARWDRMDPLCEKYYPYSPYNYCVNNPVSYIDMDGMEPNGNGWGKALGVAEMVGGALIAAVGVVATGAGVVAELPTLGGSTVITVSGGSMTLAGCGLMATGWATWNMNTNDNSYSSSSNISSGSSSSSSASSTQSPQNNNGKKSNTGLASSNTSKKNGENTNKIKVSPENKIDRNLLDPPSKPGNAPTFKSDGTKVEIHHGGQNPNGPFKEMHWKDHRGKVNYKNNHPNGTKGLSPQQRKEFNQQRKNYWRNEYPNTNGNG